MLFSHLRDAAQVGLIRIKITLGQLTPQTIKFLCDQCKRFCSFRHNKKLSSIQQSIYHGSSAAALKLQVLCLEKF